MTIGHPTMNCNSRKKLNKSNDKYLDYTYSLTIDDPNVLNEMIAQRLNRAFQLVDLDLKYVKTHGKCIYLSKDDELQTISFDPNDNSVIIIKRYESKIYEEKDFDYTYKIFFGDEFTDSQINFKKSSPYPWNHLDYLLTESSMIGPNINASSLQFHLIPNEKNLPDSRISNFKQLMESVICRSLIPENNSKFEIEIIDNEYKKPRMKKMKLVSNKKTVIAWAVFSFFLKM
jgi:hypothetical protein